MSISYNQLQAAAITPGRQTTVSFDIAETVSAESGFHMGRRGRDLQPQAVVRMLKLVGGAYILEPVNHLGKNAEKAEFGESVIRQSDFLLPSGWGEVPRARKRTELTGITASANVVTSGDYWQRRRVVGGQSWGTPLTGTAPPAEITTELIPDPSYTIDRMMRTKNPDHQPDTGYLIRLILNGTPMVQGDFAVGFEFGGHVIGSPVQGFRGFGKFYLALTASGKAFLREEYQTPGDILRWHAVSSWQYASPRDFPNAILTMEIIPHAPGRIAFISGITPLGSGPLSTAILAFQEVIRAEHGDFSHMGFHTHVVNNRPAAANILGGVPRSTTGAGPISVDFAQNALPNIQVSRLRYPASGSITDRPFTLPYGYGDAHPVRVRLDGYNYQTDPGNGGTIVTGLAGILTDHQGGALTAGAENIAWRGTTYNVAGYLPPGGMNRMRAQITLTNTEGASAKWHTPVLYGYEVIRQGHRTTLAPGVKTSSVMAVSITGPGYSPDQETANVQIEDLTDSLQFLRARGHASVRLETTYDPADPSKKTILFEGYAVKPKASWKGKEGSIYPSSEWRNYSVDLLGKWDRFANRFFYQRIPFNKDPVNPVNATTGQDQSWKVTDIIRYLLHLEGVPEDQLDIFDSGVRVFHGPAGDDMTPPPGTPMWEFVTRLASDYLNAFLVWDANAGSSGMWRLRRPPVGDETPLWNFVTTPVAAGKLRHLPKSHGANHSPIYSPPWPFTSYVIRPEGNVLTVSGSFVRDGKGAVVQVQRQIINQKSWDTPQHSRADIDDPDWIGMIRPIEYVDPQIGVHRHPAVVRGMVDFIARRVYDLACRGRKWFEFVSVLAIVDAAAVEPSIYTTRTHRPLMAGDTVLVNGQRCIVHSANPVYEKDTMQYCHYEVELFRPATTFR